MSRKRTALISAGVAAGVVATGVVGRAVLKRRGHPAPLMHLEDLPPDDLGPVESFDGTRIAVRAAGDPASPLLLFVHGFSLDMTIWHEQWTELAREYRCVVMDLRAHGRSGDADDLSLQAMGHDVAAVLDRTAGSQPVVIVGHSMGAMSILAMAENRPELFGRRVDGVALLGGAASDVLRGAMGSVTELLRPRFGSFREAARRVNRLRRAVLASPGDISAAITRLTQFGPDVPPELVDHVVGLAAGASSRLWTDGLAGLMEMDLRHAMRHVSVPALVVVGEHDRVTPPAAAVELAGGLPKGRLVVLEGAGHMAMLERPREMNDELARFAREVFGEPGRSRKRRGAGGDR